MNSVTFEHIWQNRQLTITIVGNSEDRRAFVVTTDPADDIVATGITEKDEHGVYIADSLMHKFSMSEGDLLGIWDDLIQNAY